MLILRYHIVSGAMSDDADSADEIVENDERTSADRLDGTDSLALDQRVERSFTCTNCGYATDHEVWVLQTVYQTTCLDCGDWTVQLAAEGTLIGAARDIAGTLAGAVLTERQALAYLLRNVLEIDRQAAAEAMDTSPSNVDNLQRRGNAKITDAERIVAGLDMLRTDTEW